MSNIKKVWTTEIGRGLCSLSIESANADLPISIHEHTFPANPTPDHPKRHTINLGVFDDEDLQMLRKVLGDY